jgi:TolA-binding protein
VKDSTVLLLGFGVMAVGAVGVYALVVRPAIATARPVTNPTTGQVEDPGNQSYPNPGLPTNTTPSPTPNQPSQPVYTAGQRCADLAQQIRTAQGEITDAEARIQDIKADKGKQIEQAAWKYAEREACANSWFGPVCNVDAKNGNFRNAIRYATGETSRPGNLFDFEESRTLDRIRAEVDKLKSQKAAAEEIISSLTDERNKLRRQGVQC